MNLLHILPNEILNEIYLFLDTASKISLVCYMGNQDWICENILDDISHKYKLNLQNYVGEYAIKDVKYKKKYFVKIIGVSKTNKRLVIRKLVSIDENNMCVKYMIRNNNHKMCKSEESVENLGHSINQYRDTNYRLNNNKLYFNVWSASSKPKFLRIININTYVD
uniref:F-box domain-containing protein n=1 Tax=Mimivirus LCMiAC01 TaxID=2506608 RepID=A0A481YZG1_9VIRU|nr:MAG: hypothetical protein LCMiAC01_02260 [Mimivirus LCMiAC01]